MESHHIARVAAAIGDPTRTIMLTTLLDGRAHTAGELSAAAGVSAPTASAHLRKLVDAGLLRLAKQGRCAYYQIADHQVADALESLGRLVPPAYTRAHVPKSARDLIEARSCYDHLAGRLGVAITDAMLAKGLLRLEDMSFSMTPEGEDFASELGIDLAVLRTQRRPLVKACLDWTERKYHLGGSFGIALFRTLLEKRWLVQQNPGRVVSLTGAGRENLRRRLGIRARQRLAPVVMSAATH